MNLEDLKKPFPYEKISWRVGSTNIDKKTGKLKWGDVPMCIPLAYIDARDLYDRLDEVCGAENWQSKQSKCEGTTFSSIGIKIDGEWIWKGNGAGDTKVDAEKGAVSDADKRAGVPWGVCRYLYDMPNIWVEMEKGRIKKSEYPKLENEYKKLIHGSTEVSLKTETLDYDNKRANASAWTAKAQSQIQALDIHELEEWYDTNQGMINRLEEGYKDLYEALMKAYNARIEVLGG